MTLNELRLDLYNCNRLGIDLQILNFGLSIDISESLNWRLYILKDYVTPIRFTLVIKNYSSPSGTHWMNYKLGALYLCTFIYEVFMKYYFRAGVRHITKYSS